MGKFLHLLEAFTPESKLNAVGKYAILDALEAQGIRATNNVHQPTFRFTVDGQTFEVSVRPIKGADEEAEALSPEDQAVEDEGRNLRLADRVAGQDPAVMRTKRELGTQMTNTMGQLSQGLRKIKIK